MSSRGHLKKMTFLWLALFFVSAQETRAARPESGFSFGPAFYSGESSSTLTPTMGVQVTYLTSQIFSKAFNWSHRFDLALLLLGKNLAGQALNYNGLSGTYTSAFRLNFAARNIIPFIEAGPALSIYALYTSGGAATSSKSQTALKYGYMIGTGFDKLESARGTSGWGVSLGYFHMLESPTVFEFSAGPVSAKGVKIDLRFLIGPSQKK